MSNWINDYWQALKTIIAATWTDVQVGGIFLDNVMERSEWRNLLDAGQLAVPWVVVVIEAEPTSDWGVGPKQIVKPTIFYCTSVAAAKAAGPTATGYIWSKMAGLQGALMADWTLGTTLDEVTIDVSASNPINISFLESKLKYQAGSLQVQTVVLARSS
jgi:hypothetical protein